MCVKNMPFLSVDSIIGEFSEMGVIGLAPSNIESSYVWNLFSQGQIPHVLVGLNFEDQTDGFKISMITFGYIDYS